MEVPLWVVFEHPTVEGLAGQVEQLRGEVRGKKPRIERVEREGEGGSPRPMVRGTAAALASAAGGRLVG